MTDRVSKIILRGDISDLQAKLVAAGRSVSAVADKTTAATREAKKFRDGLSTAGDAAGKLALVSGAAFVGITAVAANFEQAMSGIAAATRETAANMDLLREAALEAGARTVFSASEAAAAIENLAKAGVSTSDILGGGLDGALDLAAAGSLEVADAAEIAAVAMTQFGLSGTEVPKVADLLAAAAGKANGEVSDLAFALKQSGLVADQVGLSIEETAGGLAAFASAGLLGSDAGTSFRTMLNALTPNSKKAAQAMSELGISAFDSQGNFIGLEAVAGNLRTSLQGLTNEQRQSTLETIFGSDAVRAASVLYDQGEDGIRKWIAAVDDQGFAAETASLRLDNLKGDFEALQGSLETLFITSGEGSQGFLRGATQSATDFVNALNNLPGPAKTTATALLGITAITGGALWFGSRVVQSVANTRQALDDLGPTGTRAAGALRGVAAAGTGLAVLFAAGAAIEALEKASRESVPGVEELTDALLDLGTAQGYKQLTDDLGSIGDALQRIDDPGFRAQAFDKLGEGGRQLSAVASGIEFLAGKTTDFGSGISLSMEEAEARVSALDAALANIANTGGADQAAAALSRLAKAEGLSATETADLTAQLPAYREALAGLANQARLSATGESALAGSASSAATSLEDQTEAIQNNIDAMREKTNLAIAAENAEIGYERALDAAKQAIKDNGETLDITTEKGRANKEALLDVASAYNDLSDQEKNSKGARRDAIASFVDLAEQMGMGEQAARKLAKRLLEIPTDVVTKATLDTTAAENALRRFIERANGSRIVLNADGSFTSGGRTGMAEGGPVEGGVPGRDSVPALLMPNEHVWTTAEVAAIGGHAAMYRIRDAARRGQLRGFAAGGAAGERHSARSYVATSSSRQVSAAVSSRSAAAGPAGPLMQIDTLRLNDESDLRRYAQEKSRLRAGGGVDF